jgi:phosphopantothenoylcysteine decarboxylase/phosphopantothenate--cysteine ligase
MTARLGGRRILLGVTGSIAAYKAIELLRLLVAEGADVEVLMTHSAQAFVGPLSFETLSGHPVLRDPLELRSDRRIAHIVAGESADAIVVAPATAHWLGSMAHGMAGDVITATCLAASAPVVIAPAMDGDMYAHPATRENVARLTSFGYTIVEPAVGLLASGASGRGRLAEPPRIVDAVVDAVASGDTRPARGAEAPPGPAPPGDYAGRHILVSAGGTAEPIDPVRFIGNRSSGRMGVAIAEAALARGARVTLVAGSMSVPSPHGAAVIDAPTAAAMKRAVLDVLPRADVLFMAAAVADFRPRRAAQKKLARAGGLNLVLEPTDDILAEAARVAGRANGGRPGPRSGREAPNGAARGARPYTRSRPILVGFAAETGSLRRAAAKAARKGVDLLVANDVLEPGAGFAVDTNRVTLIVPGEDPEPWPLMSKREVADGLLDRVARLLPPAAPRGADAFGRRHRDVPSDEHEIPGSAPAAPAAGGRTPSSHVPPPLPGARSAKGAQSRRAAREDRA